MTETQTAKTARTSENPILVVGGTGVTGRRVAARLTAAGHPVRVASRSAARPFDWHAPDTWPAALAGVRRLYLVPLEGTRLTGPFLQRAAEAGVERVVLLSGRGVDNPDYLPAGHPGGIVHVTGEEALRASDLEWTVIRPSWFSQNFSEGFLSDGVRSGDLRIPGGDAAAAFVDAEDIADVAVAALTEDGHQGATYELSGPAALTLAEAMAEISEASGTKVGYTPLTLDAFTAELVADGWDAEDAREFGLALTPLARGLDAHLSDGVRRALGREPRSFAAFAADAAAAGAWA
ncbi:NAD(P)H-binding protein [Streptomyces profundus]|uniref:NAD(P)H-binding protein n=1 Tax=Streptomyces profundus TaxID=2867410 RepID=UPI001D164392|nr:NAD(P)H-binding protein [Streptomyces sp. MA3_2.13]UED83780.1 NAD(P)H-binding protein [Streptomyces sp. MA3_2.13]